MSHSFITATAVLGELSATALPCARTSSGLGIAASIGRLSKPFLSDFRAIMGVLPLQDSPMAQKNPWYKRYSDAAIAGMTELTLQERGAYNSIIDLLYSRDGDVSGEDDAALARMLNCHKSEWKAVKAKLIAKGKIWLTSEGKLTAKRVENELKDRAKRSETNSKNVGKRWEKIQKDNENNDPSIQRASAVVIPIEEEEEEDKEKKDSYSGDAGASHRVLEVDFERFWKVYPRRDGANPKAPARQKFRQAVRGGADPETIIAGAAAYANAESERIGTPYIAQTKTWLNQRRWEDYGPLPLLNSTGPPQPPSPDLPTDKELRERYGADRETTERAT